MIKSGKILRNTLAVLVVTISLASTVLFLHAKVSADTVGMIEGQIINGTTGMAAIPDNQEISLIIYQGSAKLEPQIINCDPEGNFNFSDLNVGSDYVYLLETSYQGIRYISDYFSFQDTTDISYQMTVFNTTNSSEQLSVAMAHTIVAKQGETLIVMNYFMFNNPTDVAYIGDGTLKYDTQNITVLFPLPPGASNLQLDTSIMDNCIVGDGALIYTGPIIPGNSQASYSYILDVGETAEYTLQWSIGFPADIYEFLITGDQIDINTRDLEAGGPLTLQGQEYQYYSAYSLASGQTVETRFSFKSQLDTSYWAWLALGSVLVVLTGVFVLTKSRKRKVPISNDEQSLLKQIAQLDDSYESGMVPEEAYILKRDQLIRRAMGIKQKENRV